MSSTIDDFLHAVDPIIAVRRTEVRESHTEIKNPKWPRIIRKWSEFDDSTLRNMSGGVFQQELQAPLDFRNCDHDGHNSRKFDAPNHESSLDIIIGSTVFRSVNCALFETQRRLHDKGLLLHVPKPGIEMVKGEQAERLLAEVNGSTYRPDWAGCLPMKAVALFLPVGQSRELTRLPGDTKLRWKVDFRRLNAAVQSKTELDFVRWGLENPQGAVKNPAADDEYKMACRGVRHALIQIYTYCVDANCRYGYIITETQLLVIRIQPISKPASGIGGTNDLYKAMAKDGLLEYRLVNYNVSDRTELSVNLSLWWLHLLAAIDHKIQWHYEPLMDMKLDCPPSAAISNSRAVSPEYEAPPRTRIIEPQPKDLRVPPSEVLDAWPGRVRLPRKAKQSKQARPVRAQKNDPKGKTAVLKPTKQQVQQKSSNPVKRNFKVVKTIYAKDLVGKCSAIKRVPVPWENQNVGNQATAKDSPKATAPQPGRALQQQPVSQTYPQVPSTMAGANASIQVKG